MQMVVHILDIKHGPKAHMHWTHSSDLGTSSEDRQLEPTN